MQRPRRSPRGPFDPTRALRDFLAAETRGGAVLLAAAVLGMVWANSPWGDSYHRVWETVVSVSVAEWSLALDLRHWVNDGLMALFFVVVGLEIKRELTEGELRDRRQAVLPVLGAVGGMAVPAAIYFALNAGEGSARGWGIPMATDIAFALGVGAVVARGLPSALRLFLLTLAIVDDIGAIVVIALFYSGGIGWTWLGAAGGILLVASVLRRTGLVHTPLFVGLGLGLWLALHESGVHATLAGVAMGLLAPTRPLLHADDVALLHDELGDVSTADAARTTSRLARAAISRTEWIERGLHPWTTLAVVPVFALANAGVPLSWDALDTAVRSPVAWGVLLGLVVGKTVGISAFAWLGVRLGLVSLPHNVRWSQLVGTAALGGIGFTVSLFVTALAFEEGATADAAKVGILAAAVLAALVSTAFLRPTRRGVVGKGG